MLLPALFAIVVGMMMIIWWITIYIKEQIPELTTNPVAIRFHLAAEFATAIALITGGLGLLMGESWGTWLYLVSTGMLLYTLIVSPGYMLQNGNKPVAILFGLLTIIALTNLTFVI